MITLEDFFMWFNPNNDVYEFRIMNFKLIKYIAEKLNLPYSVSGIYISTLEEYKSILPYIKGKENVWLSVNSKKKAYLTTKNGDIYKGYTGKDIGIQAINNIFIDIDPKIKEPGKRIENLKFMYKFVQILLDDLAEQNIHNIAVICSGYGFQLLIKLDVPLVLPEQTWDGKYYIQNNNFENYKILIKKAFFSRLMKKHSEEAKKYNCDIDKSASNIGRIFACVGTSNIKYNTQVPRVCMRLKNEKENDGLSDWLISDNIKQAPIYNQTKINKDLLNHFKLTEKTLIQNKLVQFMLKTDNLPEGGRNNMLLFSLKNLIKDNSIDFNSEVVKHIKMLLDKKWGRNNPMNKPENRFHFNPNVVNSYCVMNKMPLLYKENFEYRPSVPRNVEPHIFTLTNYKAYPIKKEIVLDDIDLYRTVKNMQKLLLKEKDDFMKILYNCLYYIENKYDINTVEYMLKEVCPYYFNYILL